MIKKRFANTVMKVYSKQEILKLTVRLNTTTGCSNAKDHGSLFWRWSSWPPTDFDSWHLGSQHSCGFRDRLFHMFPTPQVVILVHALWFFFFHNLFSCPEGMPRFPWRWALAPPAFMRYGACEREKRGSRGALEAVTRHGCGFLGPNHSKLIQLNQTNQQNLRKQRYTEVSHGFIRFHDVFFLNPKQLVFCDQSPKHSCRGCSSPTQDQWLWEAGPYWFKHVWKDSNTPMSQVGFHLRVFVRPPDFPTSNYYFWKA